VEIKVLGACCGNCDKVEALTKEVLKELGTEARVEKVSDFKEIMRFGVMTTPGLVIDGQVKMAGRVPSKAEITSWVNTTRAQAG